uniref:Uncharacterized protein n=1 Tax=Arundo donax TaxID=35708 RepID=A0A0A9EIS7_ARUDO
MHICFLNFVHQDDKIYTAQIPVLNKHNDSFSSNGVLCSLEQLEIIMIMILLCLCSRHPSVC